MTNPPDAAFARLERHLGWLLISGVAVSAALLSLGLLLLILSPNGPAAGHFLASGLIILMATPMLRVVLSIVEYVRMGEWLFVLITVVVFIELAAGVVYALRR
jgi:uncharacterized membrane protein